MSKTKTVGILFLLGIVFIFGLGFGSISDPEDDNIQEESKVNVYITQGSDESVQQSASNELEVESVLDQDVEVEIQQEIEQEIVKEDVEVETEGKFDDLGEWWKDNDRSELQSEQFRETESWEEIDYRTVMDWQGKDGTGPDVEVALEEIFKAAYDDEYEEVLNHPLTKIEYTVRTSDVGELDGYYQNYRIVSFELTTYDDFFNPQFVLDLDKEEVTYFNDEAKLVLYIVDNS